MRIKRAALVAGIATSLPLASAGAAQATHTHAMVVGNGKCVVIAEGAGEEDVNLPGAVFEHNPNVVVDPAPGRNHPLHVLVHRGVPGQSGGYYVYGSAEGNAACSEGYVNRASG